MVKFFNGSSTIIIKQGINPMKKSSDYRGDKNGYDKKR
jgi:hypothetical protein